MKRKFFRIAVALLFLHPLVLAFAEPRDAFSLFEEEAQVTTASRRPQSLRETPVAVDVISSEEIRASGAMNIWDLLRFRVGMEVLENHSSIDGNRSIVAIRGFPQLFASNIQVLVDGRSVYKANTGGVFWDELPVQIQDLERIEITRGPNAALYGTGASLGVINFITRAPDRRTTVFTDNRVGNRDAIRTAEAVESHVGKATYRASYTFRKQSASPRADGTEDGNDFLSKQIANFRSDVPLSEKTSVKLFAGGAGGNVGLSSLDRAQSDFADHFETVQLTHVVSADSSFEVTASRSDSDVLVNPSNEGLPVRYRDLQYDADALHRLNWLDGRANTTYGGSYRRAKAEGASLYPGDGEASVEFFRGYLSQSFQPSRRFSVQSAVALEKSDVSESQPSYQAAAIFSPVPQHSFRASYSHARTIKDLFSLFGDIRPTPFTHVLGNPDLEPYRITSYEIGYRGDHADHLLQSEASLFYTDVDNFQTIETLSTTFPGPVTTVRYDENNDAIARGAEVGFKYRLSPTRRAYVNYTYEHISDTAVDKALRATSTPKHKVNVGGFSSLGHRLSMTVDLGYKNAYVISSETAPAIRVPSFWRFDARLAYSLRWLKSADVFIAGQNLFERRHVEFPDGLLVPRTYQLGLLAKF